MALSAQALPLGADLWVAERPFTWNGIDVGGKMAVARLSDGSLWVHSPVGLDDALRSELVGPQAHDILFSIDLVHPLRPRRSSTSSTPFMSYGLHASHPLRP